MADLRRADDQRIGELQEQVRSVAKEVRDIRDMLISEPEASPLGRALIKRSVDNRLLIDELRHDFEPVEIWYQQARGAWRLVLGLATVLSIIGAFFGLAAYFGR